MLVSYPLTFYSLPHNSPLPLSQNCTEEQRLSPTSTRRHGRRSREGSARPPPTSARWRPVPSGETPPLTSTRIRGGRRRRARHEHASGLWGCGRRRRECVAAGFGRRAPLFAESEEEVRERYGESGAFDRGESSDIKREEERCLRVECAEANDDMDKAMEACTR
jgi:hypothetical protein